MNRLKTAWLSPGRRMLYTHTHTSPRFSRPFNSTTKRLTQSPHPTATKRNTSNPRTSAGSNATVTATTTTTTRFDRFLSRTPTTFLRTRLQALKSAPLATITSFLILHEITAVVPLFALAGFFHYYNWLPPFFAEGAWVLKGVTLFGNYFRRKGWITSDEAQHAKDAAEEGELKEVERRGGERRGLIGRWLRRGEGADNEKNGFGTWMGGKEAVSKWWNRGEGGTRLVIEFATAYAVVKVLLPLRIVLSVWGAPWFARLTVIPISNYLFKRGRSVKNVVKVAEGSTKGK